MADFRKAQAKVKVFEGGYSNDPRDKGNFVDGKLIGTNHGISAPVLKEWLGRTPTVDDMKNLSYETALQIYKKNYWNPIGGDRINNQSIAELLYDHAVNAGLGNAAKVVSDSLGVKVGIPFTTTVDRINSHPNQKELFEKIKEARKQHYERLGGYALNSWLNRLKAITFQDIQNNIPIILSGMLVLVGVIYIIYHNYNYKS